MGAAATAFAHEGRMTIATRSGGVRNPRRWAAVLAVLLAWCIGATAAPARDFRAADTQSENYPTVQAMNFMNRLVMERTNGRHRILVFHSRQLGEEKETIEQTRAGAIDINRTNVAPIGSFVPEANALALPFLFRSIDHLHRVLDGPIGDAILQSFDPYGFVGLTFYDSGARSVYNSVRPIRTPADMKGLRIRVQQSDLMMDMIQALGAVPVALPYGQVLAGLSTRVIDGAENNWPSYVTTNHYKSARYYTLTEHVMSPEVLIMSRRAWDALSPDDQNIFRNAARESSQFMRETWRAWEERSRREAQDAQTIVIADFERAPFEAAMKQVYAKAFSDAKVRELAERVRQAR
jgi:tripartite ATP-independent transporter DctP family solute receptor